MAAWLGACSTSAPALPTDTTGLNRTKEATLADFAPADAALSCDEIAVETGRIKADMQTANGLIVGNRGSNQVALYLSAFFIFSAAAAKTNDEEKALLVKAQERRDVLIKLAAVKGCPQID